MTFARMYLDETARIAAALSDESIERAAILMREVRDSGGRLFFIGVGGGAGHASHAVCDFRKIAGFEAYTPADNVSELSARTNDEGWDTTYSEWLKGSRLSAADMVFVFSVGGGDLERNISANLVRAVELAREVGAKIVGVVGRDGGYTARVADAAIVVPTVNPQLVTAHTEEFQAIIWHLLVSHPLLQLHGMKWESAR
ncbi:MAG TPA: SIS domain-containing protein [Vicinamibacterales bacterium]|nr:SIS domain-containing protein [Vicinamibacterales bacterium]